MTNHRVDRHDEALLIDITSGQLPESKTGTDIPDDVQVKFDMLMFTGYNLNKGNILHDIACKSIQEGFKT